MIGIFTYILYCIYVYMYCIYYTVLYIVYTMNYIIWLLRRLMSPLSELQLGEENTFQVPTIDISIRENPYPSKKYSKA